MRISAVLRSLVPLLAMAATPLLRAQFQAPTQEELSMTADPKAPGAAAVYLNIDEVSDDQLHYYSKYVRIKVLQDKGKDLATIDVPYLHGETRINDIKGRTIHPDGTITPLTVKSADLLIAKSGDEQVNRKVFTLPDVGVGSILEYRYQLDYDEYIYSSPTWEIQRPYFVHQAHYKFTPFKAFLRGTQNQTSNYLTDEHGNVVNTLIYWPILPPGVQVEADAIGRYSIDVTDIPPAPDEQWMPPVDSLLYKVVFYYKNAKSPANFWIDESKFWSKDTDHFAEPTKSIRSAVAGLIAPTDSDLDKARKLYAAVQALDNSDFSRAREKAELKQLGLHAAKRAEDTLSQKRGSSNDIALLYLAMLRAAGLTAYDLKVVDREKGIFTPGYLYFGQLTDDVVVLSTGGKDILLDPGEKMCPFQTLSWRHSSAGGIREASAGSEFATSSIQAYTANTLLRAGDIDLDAHGVTTGDFRFVMAGQQALRWRQDALRYDLDEVKHRFDRWLQSMTPEGVEVHVDHFLGLDNPDSSLMAIIKAQGTLGAATSKRLLIPGFFFETGGRVPFVDQSRRIQPVDMHYGEQITDQVVYHLPTGLAVESAPQDTKVVWEGHAALVAKSKAEPAQVTVVRQFSRAFTLAKPDEYQDLRAFYQKVAAADQQQLVLTGASSAAKGN